MNNKIMKRIKFFSSFAPSPALAAKYTHLYDITNSKKYGKEYVFTIGDDYTHAIILNTGMPILDISKENVIGLAHEPIDYLNEKKDYKYMMTFFKYAREKIGKYFIGSSSEKIGCPFINHYGYLYHIKPLTYLPKKKNIMSIMISEKFDAPGHRYRHQLTKKILLTKLPVDIYGKGCRYYYKNNDSRIKGEFISIEPYENYQFHICIENFIKPHYFSEKITNSLLCSATPIYHGCINIDSYFPDNVIHLSADVEKDILLLNKICANPLKYTKTIDPKKIIQKISIENVIENFI